MNSNLAVLEIHKSQTYLNELPVVVGELQTRLCVVSLDRGTLTEVNNARSLPRYFSSAIFDDFLKQSLATVAS